MSKVLFLVNHDVVIYNFRLELVERLLEDGHKVIISSPYGERIEDLKALGCEYHDIDMERRGINLFKEIGMLFTYRKLIFSTKPDIILTYTIKPNIYGGMVARLLHIPYITNITGLGTALEKAGLLQFITVQMYRIALKKASCIFCQNKENRKFLKSRKITARKVRLLPGSGVNLQRFAYQEYPKDTILKFAFVSRVMKEKGIMEYLEAAKIIRQKYPNTQFHICGFCEDEFENELREMQKSGAIEYHGMVSDIQQILKDMHCIVLPSYHEGMSNALLEAAATGRPLIASDISGCKECLQNGESGFLVRVRDAKDLTEKIEKFIGIPYDEKKKMGLASRKWIEQHFDRKIVVDAYMEEIQKWPI